MDPVLSATIFALSTAPGRAGIAVIRLSGEDVREAVEQIAGGLPKPRQAALREFKNGQTKELIDKGLVLWFPAPASFTGEDMAEFQVHGSRAVIQGLIDALKEIEGLRLAEPGEFARRAFDNGKIDLTEAEGLSDLINAETEAQRHQALRQSNGALRELYERWRWRLIDVLAQTEATLDFSDEGDVPDGLENETRRSVQALHAEITAHLADNRRGEILRDGFRVVIAGPPNAGKSTLLNLLAQRDIAIVSEHPGTTRDSLEVRLDLGGWPVIVIDTAGLRKAEGEIEQEGIRRTVRHMSQADLIFFLIDGTDPHSEDLIEMEAEGPPIISIFNKIDLLLPEESRELLKISAKTGEGIEDLITVLLREVETHLQAEEAPAITRARHRHELERALQGLNSFLEGSRDGLEFRAEDLRLGLNAFGRITGRVDVEDILERIFSDFCIGK